jgi:serine/threonine protein kinase
MKDIETLAEEANRYIKAPGSTINPDALAETRLAEEGALTVAAPLPSLPSLSMSGAEFEPLKLLGEGGMGRVELMRQRSLRREVAVKSVKPSRLSPHSSEALLKEAIFTGTLEHPNIVPVHIVALNEENQPVLVMKRIEGLSLRELLLQPAHPLWGKSERSTRVVEILMQVCNAVYFAHERGILHRDIKPENIMLGFFGEVYLVDWGVAIQLTDAAQARGLAGTPSYMAPESVNGGPLRPQTDIYLLGGCLYEALSGRPPNAGDSIRRVLLSASAGEHPPLPDDTPKELAEICERALRRDPLERYESAQQLREALALFLQHQGSVRLTREALSLLQQSPEERQALVERRSRSSYNIKARCA